MPPSDELRRSPAWSVMTTFAGVRPETAFATRRCTPRTAASSKPAPLRVRSTEAVGDFWSARNNVCCGIARLTVASETPEMFWIWFASSPSSARFIATFCWKSVDDMPRPVEQLVALVLAVDREAGLVDRDARLVDAARRHEHRVAAVPPSLDGILADARAACTSPA